jgi:hypothetical protein
MTCASVVTPGVKLAMSAAVTLVPLETQPARQTQATQVIRALVRIINPQTFSLRKRYEGMTNGMRAEQKTVAHAAWVPAAGLEPARPTGCGF